MSQNLSCVLDVLSKKQENLAANRRIFTTDFINQWPVKSQELCSQFSNLENNQGRKKWLKEVFNELMDILSEQRLPGNLSMPSISKLIDDIILGGSGDLMGQELTSIVGKMFISVLQQSPEADDNKVAALARITNSLHRELFKFSRISTKLLNNEQTVLLKHLLKKSKYELKKFNLLAECSTGYSQLTMLLIAAYNDIDKMQKITYYLKQLYHIVGKYSLDSMRTLDIILQLSSAFITDHYMFLVKLLKKSDYWPTNCPANNGIYESLNIGGNMIASNIIAFSLSRDGTYSDSKYLDMVCILIKYGFVNFVSIWENVGPDNESLERYFVGFEKKLEAESMKNASNPLAMAAALTADEDTESVSREDGKEIQGEKLIDAAQCDSKEHHSLTQDDSCDVSVISKGKLQLLERLIVHGCTCAAFYVLKKSPKFVQIHDRIPIYISRIFNYMIEPLYHSKVFSPCGKLKSALLDTRLENGVMSHKVRLLEEIRSHDPFSHLELRTRSVFYFSEWSEKLDRILSVEQLFKRSHEFLTVLGTYLAKDPKLITKICRIGIADIKENPESIERWMDYARKFIFPATPTLEINPVVASEIYGLMKLFPFEKRYFMYNEMLTKLSQDDLPIKFAFNRTEREAKGILKALSVDNIEQESRKLAKLASTNPLAVLIPTVKQIENYDKVSELVVFSAKYFNDFAYDALQYVLLLRLTNGKTPVQSDGVNQAMWVQRLAVFIANLTKSCEKMNINNIITYIVKTLHQGNIIAVSLMKELINKVGGIRDLNEVNLKQLKMLNSGEPLKRIARKLIFDTRDEKNEIATKLLNLFSNQNAVSEVILLLYRLNLKANSHEAHYKILSSRCDEMNTLLWSFIELVKHCFKRQVFSQNVLPFDILKNDYHVSTPWAFHIWRDYMEESNAEGSASTDKILDDASFEDVDFSEISKELFITFWKLSLYEVQFDKVLYEERKISLEEEKSEAESTRKKNELSNKLKDLLGRCLSHQKTFNENKSFLEIQASAWKNNFSQNGCLPFFQHCIIPRVLFSPADAMYAAFFLKTFDVPYQLLIFGQFVDSKVLGTLLFCCTRLEAGNIGIFYRAFLGSLEELRNNDKLDKLQHRELYDMHCKITEQLIETLRNKNYMSIRNGIELMKHLSFVFPVVDTQIELVCVTLEENLEEEQREDIKLPTNALLGHLKARLKKATRLLDYCELNDTEKKDQNTFQSELDELKQYNTLLANERKQAELRKKFEMNKKQREESQKMNEETQEADSTRSPIIAIPKGPSADISNKHINESPSPPDIILEVINEVSEYLRNDRIDRVLASVGSEHVIVQVGQLLNVPMPIHDLRNSLFEILEKHFLSLSRPGINPDIKRSVGELKNSVEHITRDGIKRNYEDSSVAEGEKKRKLSRYNSDRAVKTSGQSFEKTNERGTFTKSNRQYTTRPSERDLEKKSSVSRFSNNSRPATEKSDEPKSKTYYTNRQHRGNYQDKTEEYAQKDRSLKASERKSPSIPLAPSKARAVSFPDGPSSTRGVNKPSDRKPQPGVPYKLKAPQNGNGRRFNDFPQETEERPTKKIRLDEKRYNPGRKDDKSSRDHEASDGSRYNKSSRNQPLPQGPRASTETNSRYQG